MILSQELPKTSLVNAYTWEEAYINALKDNNEIVVITISSKLSGTYQSAVDAAINYENVYVVDSVSACVGERMLCEYALRLVKNGYSAKNIAEELEKVKNKITIMAIVDTLKYLKKGGRISSTLAFIGGMLLIKPIVALVDGEVKMIGKAMGMKKAHTQLNNIIRSKGADFDMPYGIIWSGLNDELPKKYIEDSKDVLPENIDDIPVRIVGSTIGTHIGPGAIGIAFFEK